MANISIEQKSHDSYMVSFFRNQFISTLVTADPFTVSEWISYIRSLNGPFIVGLDIEWRPSYNTNRNPVATLQLCIGDFCLIYQLIHSHGPIPESLVDFLSDWSYTFVGVNVAEDLNKLDKDYGFGGSAKAMDLRRLAARKLNNRNLMNKGLKDLAMVVMGVEVEKPQRVTMSHWDEPSLTAEQVQYACVDAYLSFEIGRTLNAAG